MTSQTRRLSRLMDERDSAYKVVPWGNGHTTEPLANYAMLGLVEDILRPRDEEKRRG